MRNVSYLRREFGISRGAKAQQASFLVQIEQLLITKLKTNIPWLTEVIVVLLLQTCL